MSRRIVSSSPAKNVSTDRVLLFCIKDNQVVDDNGMLLYIVGETAHLIPTIAALCLKQFLNWTKRF
jgi:hypothetical protein